VLLVVPIALVIGILSGAVLAACALRVSDEYFIVVSLALQIIFSAVISNWTAISGGTDGATAPIGRLGGLVLNSVGSQATLAWICAALGILACWLLRRGPIGRLILALHDDPAAVQAVGKSPTVAKGIAICVGAGLTAAAGALYAICYGYVNPSNFDYTISFQFAAIVVIGGAGMLLGPVWGSLVVVAVIPLISLIPLSSDVIGPLEQLSYGVVIVMVVMLRSYYSSGRRRRGSSPGGQNVVGLVASSLHTFNLVPRPDGAAAPLQPEKT
jgi:branched-chain amino acid transport system permease protein